MDITSNDIFASILQINVTKILRKNQDIQKIKSFFNRKIMFKFYTNIIICLDVKNRII